MKNDPALEPFIRDVPDFPKPGILFKDITPLLSDRAAFARSIEAMVAPWRDHDITTIAAVESRGFIFGGAMAVALGCGFTPIRKPGKLPWKARRHEYTLEYGSGVLEIHEDAVTSSDRVLIVDDVLATGGTAQAAVALTQSLGATVVGCAFLVELTFLSGRQWLPGLETSSVLSY